MTRIRLELKLYRFQIVIVILLVFAATVLLAWLVAQMEGQPDACMPRSGPGVDCPEDRWDAWAAAFGESRRLSLPLTVLPWVVGILLGAAVVSQEIEHRTALLAWTIDPSRSRWLARKAILLGSITVVLLVAPAVLSMMLRAAQEPLLDPWASFDQYHGRGTILVAHGLLAFAIAVLTGSLAGRVLPTLVVSTGVAAVAGGLIWAAFGYLAPTVRLPDEVGTNDSPAAVVATRYLLNDGRVIDEADFPAIVPVPEEDPGYWRWIRQNLTPIYFGYTGPMYPEVALRETIIVATSGIGLIGVTMLVVRRRRPY